MLERGTSPGERNGGKTRATNTRTKRTAKLVIVVKEGTEGLANSPNREPRIRCSRPSVLRVLNRRNHASHLACGGKQVVWEKKKERGGSPTGANARVPVLHKSQRHTHRHTLGVAHTKSLPRLADNGGAGRLHGDRKGAVALAKTPQVLNRDAALALAAALVHDPVCKQRK